MFDAGVVNGVMVVELTKVVEVVFDVGVIVVVFVMDVEVVFTINVLFYEV